MAQPALLLPFDQLDDPPTLRGSAQAQAGADDAPPTLRSERLLEALRAFEADAPPSVEVIEQSGLRAAMARVDDVDEWLDDALLFDDVVDDDPVGAPDTDRQRAAHHEPVAPPTLRSVRAPALDA